MNNELESLSLISLFSKLEFRVSTHPNRAIIHLLQKLMKHDNHLRLLNLRGDVIAIAIKLQF